MHTPPRFNFLFRPARKFLRSESGMTLPLIAFSLVVIMGLTGAGVDIARMQMLQAKLQYSLDAAGVAAGKSAGQQQFNAVATNYLNANFNNYMGAPNPTLTITDTNTTLNLTASTTLSTTFMNVVGIPTITVTANSAIQLSTDIELVLAFSFSSGNSAITNVVNSLLQPLYNAENTQNVWISVVPFNLVVNIGNQNAAWNTSGWMDTAYDSTLGLTSPGSGPGVYAAPGDPQNPNQNRWSEAGPPGQAFVTPQPPNPVTGNPPYVNPAISAGWGPGALNSFANGWAGCVMARTSPEDVSDDPPNPNNNDTLFRAFYWPSVNLNYHGFYSVPNNRLWATPNVNPLTHAPTGGYTYQAGWNSLSTTEGPNLTCPQQLLPLTNNSQTVQSYIQNLINNFNGNDDLSIAGMQWAWNMLSQNWRGLWTNEMTNAGKPANYNTPGVMKAVVLFATSSQELNNNEFSEYEYLCDNVLGTGCNINNIPQATANSETELNSRLARICQAMKNDGILIYVLQYANVDVADTPTLQQCATAPAPPYYYNPAPTNNSVAAIFQNIASSLTTLRVSH